MNREDEAAAKVQALYRGNQARKRVARLKAKRQEKLRGLDPKAVHHKIHEATEADKQGAEALDKFRDQMAKEAEREEAEKHDHEGQRPHPKLVSDTAKVFLLAHDLLPLGILLVGMNLIPFCHT